MKNIYHVSTKQHEDMKSSDLRSKNATILRTRCASALSCSNMWNSNYPHRHVNAIALHVFKAVTVKLQKFVISKPNFLPSEHRQHCSGDYQACTRDTLWRQQYVRTSKEYLIDCQILLQYFKLVFLQLQLVQILRKLIHHLSELWKQQKGVLSMKHRVQ